MSVYQLPPEVTNWLEILYAPLPAQEGMMTLGPYEALRTAQIHLVGDLITHTEERLRDLFKRRESRYAQTIQNWVNFGITPIIILDGNTHVRDSRLCYGTKEVPRPIGLRLGIETLNEIEPGLGARFWQGHAKAEAIAQTFYNYHHSRR